MFFSVLIPVYNTEKYLRQCVDSVVMQTEKDFEIVLLDDGSTDGSGLLCDEYAEQYPFVRVIHKKNEGLMMTRRRGFREAKGKYFICIDSDDYFIDNNAFSSVRQMIVEKGCDLVLYDFCIFYQNTEELKNISVLDYPDGFVFEGSLIETLKRELCVGNHLNSMCLKVCSREIVDIETDYSPWKDAICRGEDIFQSFAIYDQLKKVGYINTPYYCYRMNDANISNNPKIKFYDAYRAIYTRFDEYMEKWKLSRSDIDEVHRKHIHHLAKLLISTRCYYKHERFKTWKNYIKNLKTDSFTKQMYKEAKRLKCKRNDKMILFLARLGLSSMLGVVSYYRTRNEAQSNAYY